MRRDRWNSSIHHRVTRGIVAARLVRTLFFLDKQDRTRTNSPGSVSASSCSPAAAGWDMLLVPYRDRMESLDSGFLAASSALAALLLSPNKSRSACAGAVLVAAAAAAACVGVLAALLELTLEEKTGSSYLDNNHVKKQRQQQGLGFSFQRLDLSILVSRASKCTNVRRDVSWRFFSMKNADLQPSYNLLLQ